MWRERGRRQEGKGVREQSQKLETPSQNFNRCSKEDWMLKIELAQLTVIGVYDLLIKAGR